MPVSWFSKKVASPASGTGQYQSGGLSTAELALGLAPGNKSASHLPIEPRTEEALTAPSSNYLTPAYTTEVSNLLRTTKAKSVSDVSIIVSEASDVGVGLVSQAPGFIEELHKKLHLATDQIPLEKYQWNYIEIRIEEAAVEYRENNRRLLMALEKLQYCEVVMQGWLRFLPEMGAKVAGAFGFALERALIHKENSEMTLENLVKIRGMVARFTTRMQLYERLKPQSYTRVKDSSEKLYKAMLDCLISMIKWCKKSKRDLARSFVTSSKCEIKVQQKLDIMEAAVVDFEEESWIVRDEQMLKTALVLDSMSQNDLPQIHDQLSAQTKSIEDAKSQLGEFIGQLTKIIIYQEELLRKEKGEAAARRQIVAAPPRRAPTNVFVDPMAKRKLSLWFSAERHLKAAWEDSRRVSSLLPTLSVPEKDRANWVLQQPQFRDWMKPGPSSILYIDDISGRDIRSGPISATSQISTLVSSSLQEMERNQEGMIAKGIYFCAQRAQNDGYSNYQGPVDMLQSLVVQLLMFSERYQLHDIDNDPPTHDKMRNIGWLFRILELLLSQLPQHTIIFWIIDSTALIETQRFISETVWVFDNLLNLIRSRNTRRAIVKLLLTSNARGNADVGRLLFPEEKLSVPHSNAIGGRRLNVLNTAPLRQGLNGHMRAPSPSFQAQQAIPYYGQHQVPRQLAW